MSNKPNKAKAKNKNITKISAKSSSNSAAPVKSQPPVAKPAKVQKSTKVKTKSTDRTEKPLKEVFILVRPFVALGRYLRDSWREIRQVRWPNRKATWKMTLAVIIYCALFAVFILLLDTLFTFVFNLLLGTN